VKLTTTDTMNSHYIYFKIGKFPWPTLADYDVVAEIVPLGEQTYLIANMSNDTTSIWENSWLKPLCWTAPFVTVETTDVKTTACMNGVTMEIILQSSNQRTRGMFKVSAGTKIEDALRLINTIMKCIRWRQYDYKIDKSHNTKQ
jgi:hypothetical protein